MSYNFDAIRSEVLAVLRAKSDGITATEIYKKCPSAENEIQLIRVLGIMANDEEVFKLGNGKSATYMPGLKSKTAAAKPKDWSRYERQRDPAAAQRVDAQVEAAKMDTLRIGKKLSAPISSGRAPDMRKAAAAAYGNPEQHRSTLALTEQAPGKVASIAAMASVAAATAEENRVSRAEKAAQRRPEPKMTSISLDAVPRTPSTQRGCCGAASIAGRLMYALWRCVDMSGKHVFVTGDQLYKVYNDPALERSKLGVYLAGVVNYLDKDVSAGARNPKYRWKANEYGHPFSHDVDFKTYLVETLEQYKTKYGTTKRGALQSVVTGRVSSPPHPAISQQAPKVTGAPEPQPAADTVTKDDIDRGTILAGPGVSVIERDVDYVPRAIEIDEGRINNRIERLSKLEGDLTPEQARHDLSIMCTDIEYNISLLHTLHEKALDAKKALVAER